MCLSLLELTSQPQHTAPLMASTAFTCDFRRQDLVIACGPWSRGCRALELGKRAHGSSWGWRKAHGN